MPTDDKTKYNITDFINQEVPDEIIRQLEIADRIKHFLKPTSTSAVSQSSECPEDFGGRLGPSADDVSDEDKRDRRTRGEEFDADTVNDELDSIINDVAGLEDLTEQLEDLADEHLKDMKIPPRNDRISDAAKKMGSLDGTINKNVLDNALATMDYYPLMALGQDPVLAALVGDGHIDGSWVECNEITSELAKTLKKRIRDDYEAEDSIPDASSEITDDHEKSMLNMILEILLMLWWNMLWPKTVVDMGIINPIRMSIANPVDSLIGFFKKKRFRRKGRDWLVRNGPINNALNRLRIILICELPPSIYPRYNPIVDIDCPPEKEDECIPNTSDGEEATIKEEAGSISQMGDFVDQAISDTCFNLKDLRANILEKLPTAFGASPECVQAAKTVLDEIISDALSPPKKDTD